ncbi:restriction endonuclease [Alkalinema pantanalense CENA528]|uniref:restriction endonuclease n=1 Tax=Alkalinema pantanalense TaxID=1620705 RepID=UPI003D6E81F3
MAVPDYQSFLLPALSFLSDGLERSSREVYDAMALVFSLTDQDRKQLLPSGQQATYENRIGWALTYLNKAKLCDKPARGKFIITQRGQEVLQNKPTKIDNKFLLQFPEFQQFKQRTPKTQEDFEKSLEADNAQTPEEILQESYQALKSELKEEILQRLKGGSPAFFERVVVDLLVAMGYGGSRKEAGRAIGRTGDGGIDGIINEDPLGLDSIYIQAKRWENTVGRPVVQAFAGSLEGFRSRKGVMITTSEFSKEAKDYVTRIEKKIILINGTMLADLMIENDVGVDEKERFVVKKIDNDYFEEIL